MTRFSGNDVRRIRLANKMTHQQFADYMGVSLRTAKRWQETGAGWDKYAFCGTRFHKLEQPGLPLENAT